MTEAVLQVRALRAGYGSIRVLHGIDFDVEDGAIIALLGANGAGKTTTLRALSGMIPARGQVRLDGKDLFLDPVGVLEKVSGRLRERRSTCAASTAGSGSAHPPACRRTSSND